MVKMKKLMIVVMVMMGFVWGCGQDKYSDMMEVNDQYISVTQTYIDQLNKARTGKDIATAMNKFADEFKKLAPEMKKLSEKYPELMNEEDLPQKVKESQAKATQIGMDLAASFMKIMPHMSDPQVVEAQKRMGEVMQAMSK